MLALGQVHGGLGQGIGQALFEEFVYDVDGNPLTATFADYGLPSAADLPWFESPHRDPSPNNPLGFKGIAESGTIGAPPAVQNAVVDASPTSACVTSTCPSPPNACGKPSRPRR
jgi:aerobic carbon-monoxide dehydrogenase large subunit